ncbi:MAG: methyl-accepting chemotaxis protein [Spirirestis rafaelensis WJT71-NPBG6]|jgi:twitching motility protein PilJ|nr:methyl-accepting chemotaxis protein [Spirirestis rafaelensis WJT71-NPBG6]
MFNKSDSAQSNDAEKKALFTSSQVSFEKVTDGDIAELPITSKRQIKPNSPLNRALAAFNRLNLRSKATVLALAISTLPVLGIGSLAYQIASQSISNKISALQQAEAKGLADKVNRFMIERYSDIQVLANLPILTNSSVKTVTTQQDKQAILNKIVESYKVYDSIAVFDLNGEPILQSQGEPLTNHSDRDYFQAVLKTDRPLISQAQVSKSTNINSIFTVAPVKDAATGQTIAIVRARMPVKNLEEVIKNYALTGQKYHLIDASGKFFMSSETKQIGREARINFPGLSKLQVAKKEGTFKTVDQIDNEEQLVSYAAEKLNGLPDLKWQVILATDTATAFAPQTDLLLAILGGTVLTTLLVSVIAAWLAKRGSEDERQQKEALQMQLIELLGEVEGAASGDLTVRADVTTGEIGTVADFFNSIVENLRLIVTQVKQAAYQVNYAIASNQDSMRQLAQDAIVQASKINRTLDAVDEMTYSIQFVAENAQQAALVAQNASHTAKKSGKAMDLTVQNILHLRETVGETAKKVKRLGESTQQISRVVSLINQIATQTNLLAINAGIEAARAGEEGQGFARVAEEVGELAARSAAATKEIQQIVENIQRETSEVVQAMEVGTAQVVEGTRIVEDAKYSLSQILDVSRQIDSLVQSISTATTSQVETSQSVSQLMREIAKVSECTSYSSRQVSESLQQTAVISQELQESVETFKVD